MTIPESANFSNATRRRFIKQSLVRNAGLTNTNYPSAIKTVRGTSNIPLQTKSPFVRALADADYITDPADLSLVDSAFNRTLKQAPVMMGESYQGLYKTGRGIAPTQRQARQRWSPTDSVTGDMSKAFIMQPNLREPAQGFTQIHTHPAVDTAAPSYMDLAQIAGTRIGRVMPDVDNATRQAVQQGDLSGRVDPTSIKLARKYRQGQSLIKPGARIDSFIGRQQGDGTQRIIKYDVGPDAFSTEQQRVLYQMDRNAQNKYMGSANRVGQQLMPDRTRSADTSYENVINYLRAPANLEEVANNQTNVIVNHMPVGGLNIQTMARTAAGQGPVPTMQQLNEPPEKQLSWAQRLVRRITRQPKEIPYSEALTRIERDQMQLLRRQPGVTVDELGVYRPQ